MPEGDTIHRAAARMRAALGGREIERAAAPNPRSPLHGRAPEIEGRSLDSVEARGKHLIAHLEGDLAIHSHLGMKGRWLLFADGRRPHGKPWLALASGRIVASQTQGKVLRIVSEARLRNDPTLAQLGADPLASGFDAEAGAARLLASGGGRELGDALLDQRVLAGVGNVIRNEACFRARLSPWRLISELEADEALGVVREIEWVMRRGYATGRRPSVIYRRAGRPCPRCGGEVRSRGQGDANRIAYWCERCQA